MTGQEISFEIDLILDSLPKTHQSQRSPSPVPGRPHLSDLCKCALRRKTMHVSVSGKILPRIFYHSLSWADFESRIRKPCVFLGNSADSAFRLLPRSAVLAIEPSRPSDFYRLFPDLLSKIEGERAQIFFGSPNDDKTNCRKQDLS